MSFNETYQPNQLSVLGTVLEKHYRDHATTDEREREEVATLLLRIVARGKTDIDGLASALTTAVSLRRGWVIRPLDVEPLPVLALSARLPQ